jgi:hypothetical protein
MEKEGGTESIFKKCIPPHVFPFYPIVGFAKGLTAGVVVPITVALLGAGAIKPFLPVAAPGGAKPGKVAGALGWSGNAGKPIAGGAGPPPLPGTTGCGFCGIENPGGGAKTAALPGRCETEREASATVVSTGAVTTICSFLGSGFGFGLNTNAGAADGVNANGLAVIEARRVAFCGGETAPVPVSTITVLFPAEFGWVEFVGRAGNAGWLKSGEENGFV